MRSPVTGVHLCTGTVAYNAATGARLWVATFAGIPHVSLPPGPPGIAVSPDRSTVFVIGTTTLASGMP